MISGGFDMIEQSRWMRHHMICPEGKGETELLLELRAIGGEDILNSISCKNPLLRDLSGSECSWSCWQRVIEEK